MESFVFQGARDFKNQEKGRSGNETEKEHSGSLGGARLAGNFINQLIVSEFQAERLLAMGKMEVILYALVYRE